MHNIDRKEFAVVITEMFAAHYRTMSDPALTGWWEALRDLQDTALVLSSIREVYKNQERFPVPKNVRDWYQAHVTAATNIASTQYSQTDPRWPLPREVQLARRMLPKNVLADPLMGQAMLDYLRAHPEPEPAPALAPPSHPVDDLVVEAREQMEGDVFDQPDVDEDAF